MPKVNLPKSLKLVPRPEKVFMRPDFHTQYFQTLLSFELSEVFDDLSGPIHIVEPIEPYDGCIGEFTEAFHTYYCRMNWISFKTVAGLYEFEAPENYFAKSYWKTHPVPDTIHESRRAGWPQAENQHYQSRTQEYNKWRDAMIDNTSKSPDRPVIELGGRPHNGNWVYTSNFPVEIDKEDVPGQSFPDNFYYPLAHDGRRFRYIGFSNTFDWRCTIHLFYDPQEQRALQTFDWT
ncbi:MAG: hypothetical protein ABJN69_03255 [Hellea sp.]